MNLTRSKWAIWAGIGLAVGLVIGFVVGWWLWPVEYTNTPPSALHPHYADEYIRMVAATYSVEHDLLQAEARLKRLNLGDPAQAVVELAERLDATGGDPREVALLARLAQALGADTSRLRRYLESSP